MRRCLQDLHERERRYLQYIVQAQGGELSRNHVHGRKLERVAVKLM